MDPLQLVPWPIWGFLAFLIAGIVLHTRRGSAIHLRPDDGPTTLDLNR